MKFNIEKEVKNAINKKLSKSGPKYPVISECPVCNHDLEVTKLACTHCNTEIEGQFTLSKFNYLNSDNLYFIEVFVKNRGNIKAIEKEMGYSYPTIKKMLDEVIVGLGYSLDGKEDEEQKNEEPKQSKVEILEKIDKGEISVEEAAKLLAKIK
ncbi:MAG: DUF2089 domain-containing protein [Bacillota bacterium]